VAGLNRHAAGPPGVRAPGKGVDHGQARILGGQGIVASFSRGTVGAEFLPHRRLPETGGCGFLPRLN